MKKIILSKSEIFKKAWELARKGQKRFGGEVKEYFAESLRQVYREIKTNEIKIISNNVYNSKEIYLFIQNNNNCDFNIERDLGNADITILKNGIKYFGYEKDMICLIDEEIEEPVKETEIYIKNLKNLNIDIFEYKFR